MSDLLKPYSPAALLRWSKAHRFLALAALITLCCIGGIAMRSFFGPPQLKTTLLLTLSGTVTVTSISIAGEDIYFTQRSKPQSNSYISPPDAASYAEIKKISRADFLSGRGEPVPLHRVEGAIIAATISHDQKSLYFIRWTKENGKSQYAFCSFDLAARVVTTLGTYSSRGGRLYDVEGRYLLDIRDFDAFVTLDRGATWHDLLGDFRGKIAVWVEDGDVYYKLGVDIFHLPKSAILNRNFRATRLHTLAPDIKTGDLFIDAERQIYLTVYNDNPPFLFNLNNRNRIPLALAPVTPKSKIAKIFFKYGDTLYGTFWAADVPMTRDSVILRTDGRTLLTTDAFAGTPKFLVPCAVNYFLFY